MDGNKIESTHFCINCDEQSITLPTPVRVGYKFLGWYTGLDYTNKIEITSNSSNDLKKISFKSLPNIIVDSKNCTKTVTKTAILYAKWEKISIPDDEPEYYICEYVKHIGGFWGPYGEWSEWSINKVEKSESTIVETQVRKEVTVYENIKESIYSDVTYYRYRQRKYISGNEETRWSTCDPVDESLIKDGFTLTGNKKSA